MFLTDKQKSSIKNVTTNTGTKLEIKDDLNIMLTPKLIENLMFVAVKNSSKEMTEYSANILSNKFLEDLARIKDHFIGNAPRSKLPRRILVHLQFDAGQYFRGKSSTDLFHLNGPTVQLKKDHCYLMEIDDQRYIHNIIYDTTDSVMIGVPSWYSSDDREEKKKEDRTPELAAEISHRTITAFPWNIPIHVNSPFINKKDYQDFLNSWK